MSDKDEIREEICGRVYEKYPEWWEKTPNDDQNHEHISDELAHRFITGEFGEEEMEEKIEHCVKMFANCKECWCRWKQAYNSSLSKELSTLGYGSAEYGGSKKKFH